MDGKFSFPMQLLAGGKLLKENSESNREGAQTSLTKASAL